MMRATLGRSESKHLAKAEEGGDMNVVVPRKVQSLLKVNTSIFEHRCKLLNDRIKHVNVINQF